jgi:hypothetical protein
VSVPGLGRRLTVTFSVALLWIFGFAMEARAEVAGDAGATAAVADSNTTTANAASTDAASTDAGSGDSGIAEGTTATTDAGSAT